MNYNLANLVIALVALPADILMIYFLLKEKPLSVRARGTKKILTILFFSVFLASFINTIYYLCRMFGVISNHPSANIRSIFTNLMLSFVAWMFLIYVNRIDKDNAKTKSKRPKLGR